MLPQNLATLYQFPFLFFWQLLGWATIFGKNLCSILSRLVKIEQKAANKEQRKKSKNKLRRLCTGRSNDLKKPRIHMKNRMKVAMRTLKSNIFNSAKKSGKTWAVIKSPVKSKKSLAILGTSLVVTGGGVVLWNNYYMPL